MAHDAGDWFSRSRTSQELVSVPEPMKAKIVFLSLVACLNNWSSQSCQWMGEVVWLVKKLLFSMDRAFSCTWATWMISGLSESLVPVSGRQALNAMSVSAVDDASIVCRASFFLKLGKIIVNGSAMFPRIII